MQENGIVPAGPGHVVTVFIIIRRCFIWSLQGSSLSLELLKRWELDNPTLLLSCATLSKCHQPFEPQFPHLSMGLILIGLSRGIETVHLALEDAQCSGGAGLKCCPRSAQTLFAQLIAVMTEFLCERDLWWSQEAFGILS